MNNWQKLPFWEAQGKRPSYDCIQEILGKYIRESQIAKGVKLPSEPELIQHYGVSRTTIRKAVEILAGQGLVRKIQGKGTFVDQPQRQGVVEVYKMLETESEGINIDLEGIEPVLKRKGVPVENVLITNSKGKVPDWGKNVIFTDPVQIICRIKVIGGIKTALEHRIVPPEVASSLTSKDLAYGMLTEVLDRNAKTQAERITYTVSSRLINDDEAGLLDLPLKTAVLVRRAVYYNSEDNVISVGRMIFKGDQVKMQFEFVRTENSMSTTLIV